MSSCLFASHVASQKVGVAYHTAVNATKRETNIQKRHERKRKIERELDLESLQQDLTDRYA